MDAVEPSGENAPENAPATPPEICTKTLESGAITSADVDAGPWGREGGWTAMTSVETRCGIARNRRNHLGLTRHDRLLHGAHLDQHPARFVFGAVIHDSDDVGAGSVREAVSAGRLQTEGRARDGSPFVVWEWGGSGRATQVLSGELEFRVWSSRDPSYNPKRESQNPPLITRLKGVVGFGLRVWRRLVLTGHP